MEAFLNRSAGSTGMSPKSKVAAAESMEVPWVEKYRPRRVEDVAFQNEVVSVLQKVITGEDLPNLLFYGPPGTGKTSAAIAVCRELFRNSDTYHDRVLEMNASDERGINIVRNKIKEFARRAVSSHLPDGSPVVGLKVIILDEADAMTAPAQAALRRTMERESRTTRFILICNYITRIIDPLTSRCAKFRFKSLSPESQKERLEWICQQENIEFDPPAINELIEQCDGDMRKSVTSLQTLSSCHRKLTPADVRQFLGALPDNVVEEFVVACKSLNHGQLYTCVESIKREGYGVYQLMSQFFHVCLHIEEFNDLHKAAIFEKIGECEMRILDGANEFLQLLDLGTVVMEQFRRPL